jgi:succinate dehydrogenase/fumarate reductase flavoprotein subunit
MPVAEPAEAYDVIVAGAGAGGMTAACVCAAEGLRVLLIESSGLIGGTTAISGGMVWLPANAKMREAGLPDSAEQAERYLAATVPGTANAAARAAFLGRCDEALAYLEARTALRFRPVRRYPDYYPEAPGATEGGRVLEPVPFDATALGSDFERLRAPLPEFTLFGGMMVDRADIPHLRRATRSLASAARTARLLLRHARERLTARRGTTLVLGNALAARLYRTVLDLKIDVMLDTELTGLLRTDGAVRGVAVSQAGRNREIRAERGVVLATGGFSHDAERRARYLPEPARTYSAVVQSIAGGGIRAGAEAGAATPNQVADNALWVPVSIHQRADGSRAVYPHTVTDRAKPGAIVVDRTGRRYLNEAVSYHEFVRAMLRVGEPAVPSYLVCDSAFLWKYGLGAVKPFSLRVSPYVRSGYLVTAPSLRELAEKLSIPPAAFTATVAAYNEGAREGLDEQFGRGANVYQRHLGDGDHGPNPCVAPIEHAPYFAVALYPGDLGTAAGLAADESARVLDAGGAPIPGLYACGNDMHSIMNGAYPGPGITLGPALVFGYIAGRHIAGAPGAGAKAGAATAASGSANRDC